MNVTISSKYQVVIPKDVRQALSIRPGTKVSVMAKGGIAYIIPDHTLEEIQGMMKKVKKGPIRDKSNREI